MCVDRHECVWCNSMDTVRSADAIASYLDSEFFFVMCRSCGTKSVWPTDLSDVDYSAIQQKHISYLQHQAENAWIHSILCNGPELYWTQLAAKRLCFGWLDSRFLSILRLVLNTQMKRRSLRILEVGCNLGYLGAVLKRYGHDYLGLDIQQETIDLARDYYGDHYRCDTIEHYASVCQDKFDLIIMAEVIEHVQHPRELLDASLSLLDLGGSLVLTTPNGDFCTDDEWISDLPPIHLTLFSRRSFGVLSTVPSLSVRFLSDYSHFSIAARLRRQLKRIRGYYSGLLINKNSQLDRSVPVTNPLRYVPTTLRQLGPRN